MSMGILATLLATGMIILSFTLMILCSTALEQRAKKNRPFLRTTKISRRV